MRLLMMGTGTFAEPTFERLLQQTKHPVIGLATNPDRIAGKGKKLERERSIKRLAKQHGCPVHQPLSVNAPESVAALRALQPDLFVVAAYGQILSAELLTVPSWGAINVHASLLPKYRGAAPIAWAILSGETETGVTIIRLNPRLDAGDILAQAATPIGAKETEGELEARLAQLGADLAMQVLEQIEQGTTKPLPQDPRLVTKAPKMTKESGNLDWQKPAHVIERTLRALQPWPTAFTYWHHTGAVPVRLILLQGEPQAGPVDQPPGAVIDRPETPLAIACGQGTWLAVERLQPAGKRVMSASEFVRGHRIAPGDRFGPEAPSTNHP